MTKFEQIGVNYQQASETKHEANRNFMLSCKLCSERGLHIECDRCAIKVVHEQTLGILDDVAEYASRINR